MFARVNGEARDTLPVSDRGLAYGDGLFETILLLHGRPVLLDAHLDRLQAGCARLFINLARDKLAAELGLLLADYPSSAAPRAVLKIIVTRGGELRGYRAQPGAPANRILQILPWSGDRDEGAGVAVRLCRQQLACNPALAGLKHLNRLENVLARCEWQDDGIAEGLLFDTKDSLVEGISSNVFLVSGGALSTPLLDRCGVDGIVRRQIIEVIAPRCGLQIGESRVSRQQLLAADEVFLTNSLVGVRPVIAIDGVARPIGAVTTVVRRALDELFHAAR